jgi:molybdate transport system substrate-binding protein
MAPRRLRWAVFGLALAMTSVGCGDAPAVVGPGESRPVTVLAAASLTEAFTEIGIAFEAAYPTTKVTFSFAASSELVAQILEGAPADVFASADETNMARLTEAGAAAGDPVVFARNRLEIIVEPDNPLAVTGLADLARDDVTLILCAETVPCGEYARQALDAAGVTVTPASFEDKVKGVVSKVILGEADAGIVYQTDVLAAGSDAAGIEIPDDANVIAVYPIAATADAANPAGAAAFVDFVVGGEGQAILMRYGFLAP